MAQFENESRNNFFLSGKNNFLNQTLVSNLQCDDALVSTADKALFLLDDISEIIFHNLQLASDVNGDNNSKSGLQLIGNIILHENAATSPPTKGKGQAITEFYLFSPSSSAPAADGSPRSVLIIKTIQQSFPLELVSQWLRLVIFPNIRQFYLIDGLSLSKYLSPISQFVSSNSNTAANRLRFLFNNSVEKNEIQKYSANQTLETGNIIDGISAALIGYCEVHSLSAILCVVLRETSYTREAAQSLTQICPQLFEFLEMESLGTESWREKNDLLHQQMVKKDQFLFRTSNMFI
jgi:hypothetical protein